jgi:AcrR family transcriptional regulator
MSASSRDRIVETAMRLFHHEDIHVVGVDRISHEAGVATMTLYRQFGSKEELVVAALQRWSDRWLTWLREELDRRGDDPKARFAGLWDALEGWVTSDGFHGSFVASAATELRGQPGHPAHLVVDAHRLAFRRLLEELVQAAGAHHPVRLAAQFQVLIEGAIAFPTVDAPLAIMRARVLAAIALGTDAA